MQDQFNIKHHVISKCQQLSKAHLSVIISVLLQFLRVLYLVKALKKHANQPSFLQIHCYLFLVLSVERYISYHVFIANPINQKVNSYDFIPTFEY